MNKTEIQELLQEEYTRKNWEKLLKEVFPNVNLFNTPNQISTKKEPSEEVLQLGTLELNDYKTLGVFEVKVTPKTDIPKNRVALRNLVVPLIDKDQINGALTIYYSDDKEEYRFSFISRITEFDEEGQLNTTETNPKRYTYVLGPNQSCRTAAERFGRLAENGQFFIQLKDVIDAFSVEKLTKEFFREIADWYFWAIKEARFPEDAENEPNGRNEAVIRLITRLIFIWFMKQRKLIPKELFIKDEIEDILNDLSNNKSTYYKAILQNLFFATLNTEQSKRRFVTNQKFNKGFSPDFGKHNYYRYHELFNKPNNLKAIFKNIPFLNGGLFECLDIKSPNKNERKYIDGFTKVKKNQPFVPNYLFFSEGVEVDLNENYGTTNKKYKARGIIQILSSYNFTIDENEPDDAEVALDPEMLGKVFENLLASYNPETAKSARKATGSYYTPRPIVNYMVDESLIQYLKQKLINKNTYFSKLAHPQLDAFGNESRVGQYEIEEEINRNNWQGKEDALEKELRSLITENSSNNSFDESDVNTLIEAIDNIKVLDPAVGSGAFPMGILNRLVSLLHKLDPNNEKWKELQIQKATEETKKALKKYSKEERELVLKEINQTFDNNINHPDYARKLYLIQNCLYGIDIQPIAVQIAKLRFFISLLIEQKIDWDKPEQNYNIKPLPNLETKIVAANTLIGLDKVEGFDFRIKEVVKKENELADLRKQHFNARTTEEKELIREQDKELRAEIRDLIKEEFQRYVKTIQGKIERENIKINSGKNELERLNNSNKSEAYKKEERKKRTKEIELAVKRVNKLNEQINKNSVVETSAEKIANWDLYNHNSSSEWFDPEWMFGVREGFDIVIGNPPYLGEKGNKEIFRKVKLSKLAPFYKRKMDLFYFFFHIALNYCHSGGHICYIVTNYFISADSAIKLRNDFKNRSTIKKIINLNELKIFESAKGQHNLIILIEKNKKYDSTTEVVNYLGNENAKEDNLKRILYKKDKLTVSLNINYDDLYDGDNNYIRLGTTSITTSHIVDTIIPKIKQDSVLLNDIAQINQGILTGIDKITKKHINKELMDPTLLYHGVFVLSKDEFNALGLNKEERKIAKKWYKNSNIKKYFCDDNADKYLLYLTRDLKIENYPNIRQHISKFEKPIKARSFDRGEMQAALKLGKWWVIFAARSENIFNSEKIVCPQRSYENTFGYNNSEWFASADVYYITRNNYDINFKYLLALLNSKIIYYWLYHRGKRKGNMLELYYTPLSEIPIKIPGEKVYLKIIKKVDDILDSKNITENQKHIDLTLFRFYNMNYEEVKIIDPEIEKSITEDEYKNYKID